MFFCSRKAPQKKLLTQIELLSDCLITVDVSCVEVIQQTAALADHQEQAATGTMVLLVYLQVFGEMVDALREQGNLHIRRTRIPLVQLEISDRF